VTILEALDDPQLFGPHFAGPTWDAWRVFLAALFGLPLPDEQLAVFQRHTGRQRRPEGPVREAWLIVGRRGGKSRIAALVGLYCACFKHHRLAPGEVGTVALIAADRAQARTLFRYVCGFLDTIELLGRMVRRRTQSEIELDNGVVIEVATASSRTTRGYSFVAVIGDETAFWRTEEGAANLDSEVLTAVRPGLATTDGLLLCISTPYARRGALWDAYRRHYGQDGDPVLVWQAPTRAMNATVSEGEVEAALEEDEAAGRAEWLAEFRRDVESYVSREAVEAVTVPDRRELPPVPGCTYHAFVDPSGGSADSFTLAIAHHEDGKAVLDALRERRPPFSPEDVVEEFAAVLKTYGVPIVVGDRYAGEWPPEQFRHHGIHYEVSELTKSDLYREALPLLNSRRVELLDDRRLVAQLLALERKTARGGRDSIDHGPGGHDDVANVACGALLLVAEAPSTGPPFLVGGRREFVTGRDDLPY
jgi:hypothetical protein